MATVFKLENASVAFEKRAVRHTSLRCALGSIGKRNRTTKFYGLSGVTLAVEEGEHVGLVGRNGAGKSTLLRVLTRVITPQEGSVYVDITKHIVPLLELGIGFQPDLTGRENCFLAGTLMGYSRSEISDKLDGIVRFSELGEFIDEPVKHYSSGMFGRLAFALATDVEPEVLLVDEVFGVGDEFFMRKCIIRMQRLMQSGTTSIFVSHNLDFLVTQCQRLIWLDKGCIVMDGDPQEVASAYREHEGLAS
ncbi:MAG: ABC transporter ATP-binding protein [Phycisphaerales bacterium]|nr:MAG: ABC transporter ATP-binding protein [Phycisphaerales bacterium]